YVIVLHSDLLSRVVHFDEPPFFIFKTDLNCSVWETNLRYKLLHFLKKLIMIALTIRHGQSHVKQVAVRQFFA
ncbi:MAG: hypothetical protein PVG00_14915, partial [Desulfobacterales bacterium]